MPLPRLVDRLGIPQALAAGGHADNIDDILQPGDVVGVELYLDYRDVPAEWRMDAFPSSLVSLQRLTGTRYVVGNIGLGSAAPPRAGVRGANNVPTCPLLQIWTRLAW